MSDEPTENLEEFSLPELYQRLEEGDKLSEDVRKGRERVRAILRRKLNAIGADLRDEFNRPEKSARPIGLLGGDERRERVPRPVLRPGFSLYAVSLLGFAGSVWSMAIVVLGGIHLGSLPGWALVAAVGAISICLTLITLLCLMSGAAAFFILRPGQPMQSFMPLETEPEPPWGPRAVDRGADLDSGIPVNYGPGQGRRNFPRVTGDAAMDAMLADTRNGVMKPPEAYAHLKDGVAENFLRTDDL